MFKKHDLLMAKWSSNLGPHLLTATAITSYFSASLILATKIFMSFILLS